MVAAYKSSSGLILRWHADQHSFEHDRFTIAHHGTPYYGVTARYKTCLQASLALGWARQVHMLQADCSAGMSSPKGCTNHVVYMSRGYAAGITADGICLHLLTLGCASSDTLNTSPEYTHAADLLLHGAPEP